MDKYEAIFEKFKTKIESMSEEERNQYIDNLKLKPTNNSYKVVYSEEIQNIRPKRHRRITHVARILSKNREYIKIISKDRLESSSQALRKK